LLQLPPVRTLRPCRVSVSTMLNLRPLEQSGFNGLFGDDRVSTSSVYTVEIIEMLIVCRSEPLLVYIHTYTLFNGDEDARSL
jgi:hypothetical protein